MARQSMPTPEEIAEWLRPISDRPPPQLPKCWTSGALLFPFGDANPTMPKSEYDQVVVARIEYDSTGPTPAMRVSLYLPKGYMDFLFVGSQWYWLATLQIGRESGNYWGPFPTKLRVPTPDFLAKAKFAGQWDVSRFDSQGWVIPTAWQKDVPPHGTWYSIKPIRTAATALWRILNLDNDNPVGIPILGSYYLAYLPGFTETGPLNLLRLINGKQFSGNSPGPMLSQRDVQTALANPLVVAPCSLQDIQKIIPGINFPTTQPPLPAWTNKTFIGGWTIACDPMPYLTFVFYWWDFQRQRSEFIGYDGNGDGASTYNDRTDLVLYSNFSKKDPAHNFFTSPTYKKDAQGQWQFEKCLPVYKGGLLCHPGVGVPHPDFLSGGFVKATVAGNADFGLGPDETMLMINFSMPRGPNKDGIDVTSLFWFWFTNNQLGVLFSESNYIDTVVDHDMQVIDYWWFERNAPDSRVNDKSFLDPCQVDECKAPPSALVARRRGF